MKNFFDTYNVSFSDLKKVFPEYIFLWDKIEYLEGKINDEPSLQVKVEYNSIIDALDNFLFEPDTIKQFINKGYEIKEVVKTKKISEKEAQDLLEEEIKILEQNIPEKVLKKQIEIDKVKHTPIEKIEDFKVITRKMRKGDEYWGIKFRFIKFKEEHFSRCLMMLKAGCGYEIAQDSSGRRYVMFKLNEEVRMIVEVTHPPTLYKNIFQAPKTDQFAYILSRNKKDLNHYYSILEYAFNVPPNSEPSTIDDEFLFNNIIMRGAFTPGLIFEPADAEAQEAKIVTLDRYIEQYFTSYFQLQVILGLTVIDHQYDKMVINGGVKIESYMAVVEKVLTKKPFQFEGIGPVPKTHDLISQLKSRLLIDEEFKLTTSGKMVLKFSQSGRNELHPIFRPLQHYIFNVKKLFSKKDNDKKYYSNYNGTTLYHFKDKNPMPFFAIALSPIEQKKWGFEGAIKKDVFPINWQNDQDFSEYVEYLPFSSKNQLKYKERTKVQKNMSKAQKEKYKNQINFEDTDRYHLNIASVKNPGHCWAIRSDYYNFLKQMHKNKKGIKIMGPPGAAWEFSDDDSTFQLVYFSFVDANNNLLAIIKPLSRRKPFESKEKNEQGQQKIAYLVNYFYTEEEPRPVWDFEKLKNKLNKLAPNVMSEGIEISDAGNLMNDIQPIQQGGSTSPDLNEKIDKEIEQDIEDNIIDIN